MTGELFLRRVSLRPGAAPRDDAFPGTLPFVRDLDLEIEHPVTIFVGENGSGKSTVIEAIAELCRLPVGGGGRNELADSRAPQAQSELAPFLRAAPALGSLQWGARARLSVAATGHTAAA